VIQGHAKLETTALYTRVATNTIREVMSPLDRLSEGAAGRQILFPNKPSVAGGCGGAPT
jgi:hypothetical protein